MRTSELVELSPSSLMGGLHDCLITYVTLMCKLSVYPRDIPMCSTVLNKSARESGQVEDSITLSEGFLLSVFEKDKLNGLNFLDWCRNLRIVVKQEYKLHVIKEPVSYEPTSNASKTDKDTYKKHIDDILDIGCLMLTTMAPELQKQHEDMVAYDVIQHLKELYEGKACQERYETCKAPFRCKMVDETPIGSHVLKMIGYIESLEKLGFPLGVKLATDVILQPLLDSFSQFVLNFNMNDINKTLS
ncbi:hypothetical protein CXB51_031286 [Gossypium anomalum]|uniref:Zinc finger, CCHC-type n=1 Tax=Gossypium anomalum TaxID=47600 RepID=A0A8J5Y8E0_9ROSI|nr:hypothetical protein CXB51_031286 [Gossypium anomalum]